MWSRLCLALWYQNAVCGRARRLGQAAVQRLQQLHRATAELSSLCHHKHRLHKSHFLTPLPAGVHDDWGELLYSDYSVESAYSTNGGAPRSAGDAGGAPAANNHAAAAPSAGRRKKVRRLALESWHLAAIWCGSLHITDMSSCSRRLCVSGGRICNIWFPATGVGCKTLSQHSVFAFAFMSC